MEIFQNNKNIFKIILFFLMLFCLWHFSLRILVADYYYQKVLKTEDWPTVLNNYKKVFLLNSEEPFYHQKFSKDLKWGLKFYQSQESKLKILDLAIKQMERVEEKERSFNVKVYLAQLYLEKFGLTQQNIDFDQAKNALSNAQSMSPLIAKIYLEFCQLYIYQKDYFQAEENCQKALSLIPPLNYPRLTAYHKKLIEAEMAQAYEKLATIYLENKNYQEAEKMYLQILRYFPFQRVDLWKKIGDLYYLQGDLEQAIARNLHGHILQPNSDFWKLNLSLLYQEWGQTPIDPPQQTRSQSAP